MADGVSYEGIFGDAAEDRDVATVGQSFQAPAMTPPPPPPAPAIRRERKASPGRLGASYEAVRQAPAMAAPADEAELGDRAGSSKLDPALQNLATKVKDGRFSDGAVKVVDGKVEVFVYTNAITDEGLKAIRALGGKALNVARSSGLIRVRIDVDKLDALAALGFVTKITAPAF
jgi:hypothetical protein